MYEDERARGSVKVNPSYGMNNDSICLFANSLSGVTAFHDPAK
jgi:hypothetical protein